MHNDAPSSKLYRVGSNTVSGNDALLLALPSAYADGARPLCLCCEAGVEMYIAKLEDQYILKRMPNTGARHQTWCEHFETPETLSGLGEHAGKAIKTDSDGITHLKLGFSLTKTSRSVGRQEGTGTSSTVKAQAPKLSLTGLLHFLWHEADLDQWNPNNAKRSWYHVRLRLMDALASKQARSMALIDRLYVPEAFFKEKADELEKRRRQVVARFTPASTAKREVLIYVGEVKEFEAARFGSKIIIKHASRFPVFLEDKAMASINRKYEALLALWKSDEKFKLVMISAVTLNSAGSANLEEVGFILTNENWIPIDNLSDADLVSELTRKNLRFTKGLRYDVRDKPIAAALLTDRNPPLAMFIADTEVSEDLEHALSELEKATKFQTWLWAASQDAMPDIPN
jgi:hypothetical protein